MAMAQRANDQWVNDLQQGGPTHRQAIRDLREFLERGLYHYLTDGHPELPDRSGSELRHLARRMAKSSLPNILNSLTLFQGASQFTTWAAKFAARVVITELKVISSQSMESDPQQLTVRDRLLDTRKSMPGGAP